MWPSSEDAYSLQACLGLSRSSAPDAGSCERVSREAAGDASGGGVPATHLRGFSVAQLLLLWAYEE